MRESVRPISTLLYPSKCGVCSAAGAETLCEICSADLAKLERPLARPHERELSATLACFPHQDIAGEIVRRVKYDRVFPLCQLIAGELGKLADQVDPESGAVIVPIPIHWRRLVQRGFNQSEAIAPLSRRQIEPNGLRRLRHTRPQVGLGHDSRAENVRGAFAATRSFENKHVILIDDVCTSGATANECARVLRKHGAARVTLCTFTRADRDQYRQV